MLETAPTDFRAEQLRVGWADSITSDGVDAFSYDGKRGEGQCFALRKVPRSPNRAAETYTYDGVGGRVSKRRTTSSSGPIFEQTFAYDARGNVTTLGYPGCLAACTNLTQVPTVTNTYTNGFLSTVSGNALGVVTPGASSIDYHANGLVSSVGMNNNVAWQQGIASHWMARPTSITTSGATNNLALSNYAYDGVGNITSDGVDAFRYDKVSRLVSGTANGATQTATYDSFGNLKTLGAATLSPTATTNRLPATLASYAANGAVTAHGGDLFDLDPFGMIQAVHDPTYGVKYWAFVYAADDERIWKYDMGPANTSWWKIRDLGGKVLSEYVNVGANWTAVSSYIYRDGTLLGRYAPGTSYPRRWFAVDHLGTPRRTFGENGTLIEAASYFPFGGRATAPGPAEETLRFTSHERDAAIASGIDYMHARFYAPGVGRFLSVDPARPNAQDPQSWNRYTYTGNNPIARVDPDGRDWYAVIFSAYHKRAEIYTRREHEAIVWIDPRGYGKTFEHPAGPLGAEYVGSYEGSWARKRNLYPTHFRNLGPSFDPAAARASRDVGPDARYRSGSLQCTNYCAYLIGDPVYYKWNELLSRWWGASAPHPLLDDRTPAAGYLPGVMVNGQMWPSDIAAGVGGEYIEVLAPGSTTSVSYPDSHWFARPIANDGGTALSCYNGFCN